MQLSVGPLNSKAKWGSRWPYLYQDCMRVFYLLAVLGFKEQIQTSFRQGGLIARNREYLTGCKNRKHS